MHKYTRLHNTLATKFDRDAEYNSLVAAIKLEDADGICSHAFKLYSMLVHLPENKDVKKDMRKHYYPNMREWRKTVETHEGDKESLAAFVTIIRNAFKKLGYEL